MGILQDIERLPSEVKYPDRHFLIHPLACCQIPPTHGVK